MNSLYPTKYLRRAGIPTVRLTRSLPCKGGWLLTGVSLDGATMAIVPTGNTWTAEFDDSNEVRAFDTQVEARVWLSFLSFGCPRRVADQMTDQTMERFVKNGRGYKVVA